MNRPQEKSDPRKSVIERKVSGRVKCFFKRCSVPKSPGYVEYFSQFFFSMVKFSNEGACQKGMLDFLKKLSKKGHQFTAILDLQNNEEGVSFHPGKGNSSESVHKKDYNHWVPKIFPKVKQT